MSDTIRGSESRASRSHSVETERARAVRQVAGVLPAFETLVDEADDDALEALSKNVAEFVEDFAARYAEEIGEEFEVWYCPRCDADRRVDGLDGHICDDEERCTNEDWARSCGHVVCGECHAALEGRR